jgi:hypothetical protein
MGVPLMGVRGDAPQVYYNVTLTDVYYVTSASHGREYTNKLESVKGFSLTK